MKIHQATLFLTILVITVSQADSRRIRSTRGMRELQSQNTTDTSGKGKGKGTSSSTSSSTSKGKGKGSSDPCLSSGKGNGEGKGKGKGKGGSKDYVSSPDPCTSSAPSLSPSKSPTVKSTDSGIVSNDLAGFFG